MSRNLGIDSTNELPYYFLSYNSEDEAVVSKYAAVLERYSVPVWYDNGIDVGSKWERTIAEKLNMCDAVLMFLSKNIFQKDESYVHKEFEMAVRYFKKKVIIILLDEVKAEEVPPHYVSWWIDVTHLQCIESYKFATIPECVEKIAETAGYSINKTNMISRLKNNFDALDESEKLQVANNYVQSIISTNELLSRVKTVVDFVYDGLVSEENGIKNRYTAHPYPTIEIDGHKFDTDPVTCFHAGAFDADRIDIYRDGEVIYRIGGLFDAYAAKMLYDDKNDFLYIIYESIPKDEAAKERADNSYTAQYYVSVLLIEQPTGKAKCIRFDGIEKR